MRKLKLYIVLLLMSLFGTVTLFQNCSNRSVQFHNHEQTSGTIVLADSGNGEGYGGKLDRFEHRIPEEECLESGMNGQKLPNGQIFAYSTGLVQIVREKCADISPRTLRNTEYTFDVAGNIIYSGRTFAATAPGDFDTLAAACPIGRTPLPGAGRTNLLAESQNLMASNWGGPPIPGLTVQLIGSLASLPLFSITRSDSGMLENWRRPAQNPSQIGNQDYVFSFFASPSASERALFISDQTGLQDLEIEFNLSTGASNILVSSGVSNVSTTSRPFGGGLFLSVYFRPSVSANPHIGVASADQRLGSAIAATAYQLERVSAFCSP